MHADQRADTCQPRQVDVIFHDHHISDFVLWVEATTGVSHYEGLDAQFVHYTDRERDLWEDRGMTNKIKLMSITILMSIYRRKAFEENRSGGKKTCE